MSDDQKCYEAVLSAQMDLNTSKCDQALESLQGVTGCSKNARYLITKASAYACSAGYKTSTFIVDDLPFFSTGGANILGGLTRFSTSAAMDDPQNSGYEDLWDAINTLLYAGISTSVEPTLAERAEVFSSSDLADIHSLLSYLLMVQLGKYLYYYGNSSATGVKGSGGQTPDNGCLANYDDGAAVTYLQTGNPGGPECTGVGIVGHPELDGATTLNVSRMCQGVVLLNNLLVVLPAAIAGFTGTEFADIDTTTFDAPLAALRLALGAGNDDIVDTLNEANCIADHSTDDAIIQRYFVMVFETLFQ